MGEKATGRDGYVNGIPCITSWNANSNAAIGEYAASCTGKSVGQTRGIRNTTGTVNGIGGNPLITPGTTTSFKGVVRNDVGAAKALDGSVYWQSLAITFPKESGGNITWAANYGAQGDFTKGTVGAADATYTLDDGAALIADPVLYNDASPYTIPGFRQATLTINCPEKTHVIAGATHRLPGSISASVSIDVYDDDYENPKFAPNVIDALKLYIDATLFWNLEWLRFSDCSNFIVDPGTKAIIGYTINAAYTAVKVSTLGHITRPNGTHIIGT